MCAASRGGRCQGLVQATARGESVCGQRHAGWWRQKQQAVMLSCNRRLGKRLHTRSPRSTHTHTHTGGKRVRLLLVSHSASTKSSVAK